MSKRALRTQSITLTLLLYVLWHFYFTTLKKKKNEYMHLLVNCGSPKLSTCDEGRN